MLTGFARESRFSARSLLRNRTFTAVAVLSLALGIGATSSVFSVVDRILFRSLPYGDSDRLVSAGLQAPMLPYDFFFGSGYLQLKQHLPSTLAAVTSWSGVNDCDLTEGAPLRLSCAAVEASFLSTLQVAPVLGRDFALSDDDPHAPKTALLSYGLWKARFGGSPGVVNSLIAIDGNPVRILGVLPRDFETPTLAHADLLVPQQLDGTTLARAVTGRPLRVIARLRPGARIPQLQDQGNAILADQLGPSRQSIPGANRIQLRVRTIRDLQVGDARTVSWILLGTVLAVLLLACANVMNLLLARSFARRRELSIRVALGAGRWQLLAQSLSESLLLAAAGAAAGIALSLIMLRLFVRLAPEGIPRLAEATLDLRVLTFTLVCSFVAALTFGLVPRLLGGGNWGRPLLVVTQFALSLALLTGASLLSRALWRFQQQPLGMETQNVITAAISLSGQRYPQPAQQLAFAEDLEQRLHSIPGINALAVSDSLPPNPPQRSRPAAVLQVDGRTPDPPLQGSVVWRAVSPDYFRVLGIRLLYSRSFTEEDRHEKTPPVILSQSLARRLFGTADPVGHLFGIQGTNSASRIVGVVEDVRNSGGTAPDDPEYYVPRAHEATAGIYATPNELRRMVAIVRTPFAAGAVAHSLRETIAAMDPALPVELNTLAQTTARLSVRPRFNATLLAIFAVIGLALAAFGLYGVLGFVVAQRTREIGIRMALGATPAGISRLVLRTAGGWLAAGLFCGLALSLAVSRALASLLLGISPADPAAWAGAAAVLLLAAFAAAWIPSRRAASVDPIEALRHE